MLLSNSFKTNLVIIFTLQFFLCPICTHFLFPFVGQYPSDFAYDNILLFLYDYSFEYAYNVLFYSLFCYFMTFQNNYSIPNILIQKLSTVEWSLLLNDYSMLFQRISLDLVSLFLDYQRGKILLLYDYSISFGQL